jgi:hypothetical protein
VQQFDPLSHGVPSWPQPPGASTQRPGCPPVAVQSPEQQSFVDMQMSPGAWQAYEGMHAPPWQFREQHSSDPVQASPSVVQVKPLVPAGSGAQSPADV